MAFRVSKLVFTSSFATLALVYLSASNIEYNIRIINGNNGGRLPEIKKLQKHCVIKQNDYFLDNTSGDLYSFNYESSEWMPKTNVGLHYRKAAQEFQSIGKYILKAPVYKPRDSSMGGQSLHKNKSNETITSVKKVYYHHWAFQDVASKFLSPLENNWDIHTFSFTNKDKVEGLGEWMSRVQQFVVLAESDEGPSVLEFKCFLSTVFEIDQKYGETLKIINNFILHALRLIKNPK